MKKDVRTAVILISVGILGYYLFSSTRSSLWDRDEPRYARACVEMVESGNYLIPTFNGQVWFDKPPLLYWLMSVPIRLLGPTEFACRLFSAVGVVLTCLLTFFLGRRLFGATAGLWAMVILASTLMVLVIGIAATPDAVLLLFVVAIMVIFYEAISSGIRVSHVIVMGGALGLGMLAKGPIGLMPIPTIVTMLWFDRKNRPNIRRDVWMISVSLAIGFLIFVAWAIPANITSDGQFLREFLGGHVVDRALKPMEHHGGNFLLYLPYYLPVVIVGFFPWTLYLPGAFSAVASGRVGGKYGRMFLIGWVVPTFIIMTLAATKLPHYILFIWPALALAAAGTINAAQQNRLTERDRVWLRRGVWFFGPVAVIMTVVLAAVPWFVQLPGLRWSGPAAGATILIMSVLAIYYQRANRVKAGAGVLLLCTLVFEIPVLFGILPAVEQIKIAPPIAQAVNARAAKDIPVATYKFGEPTLNFYLGRHLERLRSKKDAADWAKRPISCVLVIPKGILNEIEQEYGSLSLEQIASKEGFNYSKGEALEVVALIREKGEQ